VTFYRRLCALNYPTVVVVLWSVGAFVLIFGLYAIAWGLTFTGLGMVVAGAGLIAVPFLLDPWA
jgi:hypothetical protein